LESDFVELLESGLEGKLDKADVKWSNKSACCVVLASGGYPEAYKKGYTITGIEKADNMVFVAGAKLENGELLTNGGRVLNVVAVGNNLEEARAKAYADAEKIEFTDKCYRKDIGVLYR
jgi:phosphoribosylamine--glycine ligase